MKCISVVLSTLGSCHISQYINLDR